MNNKKKNIKQIPYILIAIFLIIQGCKSNNSSTVQPEPSKDPRTYTWTADTLAFQDNYQTLMYDIWGSSPNDVYVDGHSSTNDGVLWHYDGNKWESLQLRASQGGQITGAFDLRAIYGFSSFNIYAVGAKLRINPSPPPSIIDSSLIIHYDGSVWSEVTIVRAKKITDIQGGSANDIWAGGRNNTLYHYDGAKWGRDSITIYVPANQSFHIESINSGNSGTYLIGYRSFPGGSGQVYYFFKRNNSVWTKLDSSSNVSQKFGDKLFRSSLGSLYSNGKGGVYKYNGSSWENIFQSSYPILSMWGSSDENIFVVSFGGRVYHYNGGDWKQIERLNLPQIDYWAVWTDGTEAFVVGHIFDTPSQKTIVWHGK